MNTETKHTRWTVKKNYRGESTIMAGDERIAEVYWEKDVPLIASAPRLLEERDALLAALRSAQVWVSRNRTAHNDGGEELQAIMAAAIAKVTGSGGAS